MCMLVRAFWCHPKGEEWWLWGHICVSIQEGRDWNLLWEILSAHDVNLLMRQRSYSLSSLLSKFTTLRVALRVRFLIHDFWGHLQARAFFTDILLWKISNEPSAPVHSCNPSTQEAEAGGTLWAGGEPGVRSQVPGQSDLHSETLSQNQTGGLTRWISC